MRRVVELVYAVVNSVIAVVLYFQLAGMRIAEWGQLSLIILGLMFGFASVLFGRARAYPQGATQRRTLIAADMVLRGIVFYLFAMALSGAIHFVLVNFGYTPEPAEVIPPQGGSLYRVLDSANARHYVATLFL